MKIDHGAQVAIAHGAGPRSPHWPTVEHEFLKNHPHCAACNSDLYSKVGVQVHHIHAFHIVVLLGRPDLELDPRNLVGLCETEEGKPAPNHHIALGHFLDFKTNAEEVLDNIQTFRGIDEKTLRTNHDFMVRVANRVKEFPEWTEDERKAYRAMLDEKLPPDPAIMAKYFPAGLPKS